DDGHFGGHSLVFECGRGVVRDVGRSADPAGRILLKVVGAHIRDNADDGAPVFVVEKANVFSDGGLTGPEAARSICGNDSDVRIGGIGFVEISAGHDGNIHDAKIVGGDDVEPEERL